MDIKDISSPPPKGPNLRRQSLIQIQELTNDMKQALSNSQYSNTLLMSQRPLIEQVVYENQSNPGDDAMADSIGVIEFEMKERIRNAAAARAQDNDRYVESLNQSIAELRTQNTSYVARIAELQENLKNEIEQRTLLEQDNDDLGAMVEQLEAQLADAPPGASQSHIASITEQFRSAIEQRDMALERILALEAEVEDVQKINEMNLEHRSSLTEKEVAMRKEIDALKEERISNLTAKLEQLASKSARDVEQLQTALTLSEGRSKALKERLTVLESSNSTKLAAVETALPSPTLDEAAVLQQQQHQAILAQLSEKALECQESERKQEQLAFEVSMLNVELASLRESLASSEKTTQKALGNILSPRKEETELGRSGRYSRGSTFGSSTFERESFDFTREVSVSHDPLHGNGTYPGNSRGSKSDGYRLECELERDQARRDLALLQVEMYELRSRPPLSHLKHREGDNGADFEMLTVQFTQIQQALEEKIQFLQAEIMKQQQEGAKQEQRHQQQLLQCHQELQQLQNLHQKTTPVYPAINQNMVYSQQLMLIDLKGEIVSYRDKIMRQEELIEQLKQNGANDGHDLVDRELLLGTIERNVRIEAAAARTIHELELQIAGLEEELATACRPARGDPGRALDKDIMAGLGSFSLSRDTLPGATTPSPATTYNPATATQSQNESWKLLVGMHNEMLAFKEASGHLLSFCKRAASLSDESPTEASPYTPLRLAREASLALTNFHAGLVDVLPHGWERKHTQEGLAFYIDHTTETTSWIHPVYGMETVAGFQGDGITPAESSVSKGLTPRRTSWTSSILKKLQKARQRRADKAQQGAR